MLLQGVAVNRPEYRAPPGRRRRGSSFLSSLTPSHPLTLSLSVSRLSRSLYVVLCVARVYQTKKFYKLVKKAAKDKICRRGVKEVGLPYYTSALTPLLSHDRRATASFN